MTRIPVSNSACREHRRVTVRTVLTRNMKMYLHPENGENEQPYKNPTSTDHKRAMDWILFKNNDQIFSCSITASCDLKVTYMTVGNE